MALTVIIGGENTGDMEDFIREQLVEALDTASSLAQDVRDELAHIDVVHRENLGPRQPENIEIANELRIRGETCQACAYYHTLYNLVVRIGDMETYYALVRLFDLHNLDECWSTTFPDEGSIITMSL